MNEKSHVLKIEGFSQHAIHSPGQSSELGYYLVHIT